MTSKTPRPELGGTALARTGIRLALVALCAPAATASDAEITLLIAEGDHVGHFGEVDFVHGMDVNSSGDWIVIVSRTTGPTGGLSASIRSGTVDLLPGKPLATPPGSFVSGMLEGQLDDAGNHVRRLWSEGSVEADAYYWNDETLLYSEGSPATAPEWETPHNHYWLWIDDRAGTDLIAVATSVETALGSYVGQAISTFQITPTGFVDEHLRVVQGQVAPKLNVPIARVVTNPNTMALNASGGLMYVVQLDVEGNGGDYAVYLNDDPLAVEGRLHRPSGMPYLRVQSAEVDLNDAGDHAFTAVLANEFGKQIPVLLRNLEIWAAEGETFPAIAPHPLYKIAGHPVLSQAGDLFWIGRWKDGELYKTGLFKNRELVVESHADTAGGQVIEGFGHYSTRLAVSDNGQWVVFDATLEGDREAAILVHLPE